MPYSQDDSQDPCGKDRSAGRNFLSRNSFIMLILTCRIPAYSISFDVLLCFPLFLTLRRILTVNKCSSYKIYDLSSYFKRRSMAIPILKALWKSKELKTLDSVLHWFRPMSLRSFFIGVFGECLQLKLNYSRKVNQTMLLIFWWNDP